MSVWIALTQPWWRPVLIVLDLAGLAVAVCCLLFGWPSVWLLPLPVLGLVSAALTFREMWVRSAPDPRKRVASGLSTSPPAQTRSDNDRDRGEPRA